MDQSVASRPQGRREVLSSFRWRCAFVSGADRRGSKGEHWRSCVQSGQIRLASLRPSIGERQWYYTVSLRRLVQCLQGERRCGAGDSGQILLVVPLGVNFFFRRISDAIPEGGVNL